MSSNYRKFFAFCALVALGGVAISPESPLEPITACVAGGFLLMGALGLLAFMLLQLMSHRLDME